MMTDERIIKYIENELTSEERIEFESDLGNSLELKEEFEKYLRVKNETDELSTLKMNPLYLDSIIPEFRNKLKKPKSVSIKRNLGYAFGVMLAFIISIEVLNNFLKDESEITEIEEFTQSLNENQKIELLEEINLVSNDYNIVSENISGKELVDILITDIEINNEVAEAYDIGYNELMANLSQQDIEKVYSEILNRNF
jgi:hypothetical protein